MDSPRDTNPAVWSGPMLMGSLLMYMLYGLLLRAFGTFFYHYKPGRQLHRNHGVLVGFIMFVTNINTGLTTYMVWKRFVLDTHIPAHDWRPPRTIIVSSFLNGTIAVCTQLFFARKVYMLGGASDGKYGKIPGIVITFLSLCHLAAAFTSSTVFALSNRSYAENAMRIAMTLNNVTALIVDIAITGSIIALLSHYKARSAFSSTKQLLSTITRHTIENGLAITLTVTCNIITVYTREDNVHESFRIFLPALYALTLVTSLNRASSASEASVDSSQRLSISGNMNSNFALNQTAYGGQPQANVISFDQCAPASSLRRPFSSIQVQVVHHVERSVSGRASLDTEDIDPPLTLAEKPRAWDDANAPPVQREQGDKDKAV